MLKICVQGKTCKDGKYRVFGYIPHNSNKSMFLAEDEPTLLAMVIRHIDETDFSSADDLYSAVNKRQSFIARIVLK